MVHVRRHRVALLITVAVTVSGVVVSRAAHPPGRWLDSDQRIVDGVVTVGERTCTNVGNTGIDCEAIFRPVLDALKSRKMAGHVTSVAIADLPMVWQNADGQKTFSHGTPRFVESTWVVLVTFEGGDRRAVGLCGVWAARRRPQTAPSPAITAGWTTRC